MFQIKTLLAVFCMFFSFQSFSQVKAPAYRIAPEFALPAIDGKILKSSYLKGSVVLLEFFQTECVNCQLVAPKLEILHLKYQAQGFSVVGVSFDKPNATVAERSQTVERFVKRYGLTYPVLLGDGAIWMNYIQKRAFSSPFVVLIDRKGMIVGQFEEGPDHKACDIDFLETHIKKLFTPQR